MKEYEIKGRLPSDGGQLLPDPHATALIQADNEQDALTQFKKSFPNIPVIGWVVSKILYK